MSKELEALKRLWEETKENTNTSPFSNRSDYDKIREALTPPTEEEVCEALNEHFKYDKVGYNKYERVFIFVEGDRKDGYITRCNKYHDTYGIVGYALPPHLITLIGRFYQSLDKKLKGKGDDE